VWWSLGEYKFSITSFSFKILIFFGCSWIWKPSCCAIGISFASIWRVDHKKKILGLKLALVLWFAIIFLNSPSALSVAVGYSTASVCGNIAFWAKMTRAGTFSRLYLSSYSFFFCGIILLSIWELYMSLSLLNNVISRVLLWSSNRHYIYGWSSALIYILIELSSCPAWAEHKQPKIILWDPLFAWSLLGACLVPIFFAKWYCSKFRCYLTISVQS
jgi:hypothetical protein